MTNLAYPFMNFSLTPSAFATVARLVAPGKKLRRAELTDLVLSYHFENGGGEMTTPALLVAKKALSIMASDGFAEPTGMYGVWKIFGEDAEGDVAERLPAAAKEVLPEYIYAYYLPAYRELAELRGEKRWPHKIGLTTVSVEARIAAQVGTALPEKPTIIKVIETSNCYLLEKAIHSVLELRGFKISDAPGNEWFLTNLDELDDLIKLCSG